MARRLITAHNEHVRAKIQASVILHRLQQHFMGELELSPTQIKAAAELLDRSVPKMQHIQTDMNINGEVVVTHKIG